MHVCLITDGIWPYVLGGMQKHSYYICKFLAGNGVKVDLVHFNRSTYDISKLEFFSEGERKNIRSILVDFPKEDIFPGHYLRASKKHAALITETLKYSLETYDFIYTKGFTGWDLIEKKKKGRLSCAKIGVNFHGYEMFQPMPGAKAYLRALLLLRRPVKQISRDADIVFSYGGKINGIIEKLGVKRDHMVEIPSGVERNSIVEDMRPVGKKIKFLFLGRYERRKGMEELNVALKKFSGRECEFHFIGPIPENKKVNQNNVIYHGEIRDKEILASKISGCDVLLCPSWSEGMPNAILEAMANGLAVIATDVGATSVLVDESVGWLISSPDPGEIYRVILRALDCGPEQLNEKRRKAIQRINASFTWESLISQLKNRLAEQVK